jgi:hypothetical protein
LDEFRIEPTAPDNPYRDSARYGAKNRKKHNPAAEVDDVVSLSGENADSGGSPQDYYSPSKPPDDQE